MNKNIAVVIAHYDVDGRVALDIIELIHALKKWTNFITFVSTNICKDDASKVSKMCELVVRENIGFDFSSYKVGIDLIKNKEKLDSILIINSSVIYFNPKKLLDEYFLRSSSDPALFGLTESLENGKHVQSFWVEFCSNQLINSAAFGIWWDNVQSLSSQTDVILKYEIGMSRYFENIGVKLDAIYKKSVQDKILAACRSISDDHCYLDADIDLLGREFFNLPINLAEKINPTTIL